MRWAVCEACGHTSRWPDEGQILIGRCLGCQGKRTKQRIAYSEEAAKKLAAYVVKLRGEAK